MVIDSLGLRLCNWLTNLLLVVARVLLATGERVLRTNRVSAAVGASRAW